MEILWKMKVTVIPIGIGAFKYSHQRNSKGTGGLGNKRTNEAHPNYNNVYIGQNTEKSPGDLRRLDVMQNESANDGVKKKLSNVLRTHVKGASDGH